MGKSDYGLDQWQALLKQFKRSLMKLRFSAKIVFKGDLNIFVRTASKYDDVQLLKLPNLNLILGFHWVCLADPNDHHNVIYCAPDKIPEYSSNQVDKVEAKVEITITGLTLYRYMTPLEHFGPRASI